MLWKTYLIIVVQAQVQVGYKMIIFVRGISTSPNNDSDLQFIHGHAWPVQEPNPPDAVYIAGAWLPGRITHVRRGGQWVDIRTGAPV